MDFKEMNPLGIVGIVGAIIMVVGVFMNWFEPDLAGMKDLSGWDFFKDRSDASDAGFKYLYTPLLTLIMGILAIALMVLPTVMNVEKFQQINNVLGIVAIVLSVVVVVMLILFQTQTIDTYGHPKLTDLGSMAFGYWLCLIGAIITAIGGIMPILKNKGIINF